jgi:1-acyl-sn-glycerol-3-phosphate acyltransferase
MNRRQYIYRWIMWNIFSHGFINLLLKRTYQTFKTPESDAFPAPPFIVVCNHGTFFDPWLIGGFCHAPFAFMANDDGFRKKGISLWYLRSIGAFPKKKGASDYKAMKYTMDLLRNNYPVCIFPEGQTTWDGETQLIYRGIEKIIKKLNVPLVTARFQGNFLTKPWWAHFKRKGPIRVNIKVINSDTVKTLSADQIFDRIKGDIYQNELKDPQVLNASYKGTQLAKGLERFVWICMHCGKEDTLVTKGNDITCSSCSSTWHIDSHCRLTSDTPTVASLDDLKDWSDMQKKNILAKISIRDTLYTETPAISLSYENDERQFTKLHDTGLLQLIKNELRFTTTTESLSWPVEELEDYVIQKKDIFEFRHKERTYRVEFSGKSPMKWLMYVRYMNGFTECERQGHL